MGWAERGGFWKLIIPQRALSAGSVDCGAVEWGRGRADEEAVRPRVQGDGDGDEITQMIAEKT